MPASRAYTKGWSSISWNSGWKLNVRQTAAGWEAIATLPLSTFRLQPGANTGVEWFAVQDWHDYVAEFYVPAKATTVRIAISSGKEIRLLLAKASLVEAPVDATLNINPTFALEPVNYAGWMNIATGGQLIQREGKTILDTKYGITGQMIPLTQPGTYAISATATGNGYNSIVIIRVYDADGKELMRSSTRKYSPPTYFVPPPEVVYASFLVYSCLLEEVRLVRVGDASANDENRQRQRERCRP